ncbi:MAG: S1/P1 nuclease [Elusimicrobiota bacterium]
MKSPRTVIPIAFLAVAAAVCPRPAFAWSANGHKTVALIAESRLSDAAKAAVASILGPTATLDAVAPCADDIRGKTGYDCAGINLNDDPQSEPWHFVDVPISESPAGGAALEAYCPNQACVIDQINKDVDALKTSIVQTDRQLALIFLVHFVGDVHQPLHCADEIVAGVSDRGGNLKSVVFPGVPRDAARGALNLHSLWDHQILPEDSNDPVTTSQRLIADLKGRDVSSWLAGSFVSDAAFESFSIAKSTVYPAYYAPDGKSIDSAYQARMTPIVDERLERAGVRLAALLEAALVGAPAAVPAPGPSGGAGAASLERARERVKRAESAPPP